MSKVDSNFALKVQNMFATKSLFKQCVQVIALRDNFQYVTVKSNKEVMILQCAIENYKWSLRASCCIHGDRSLWILTRFDSKHTCSVDVSLTEQRQTTFTIINDLIKNKISSVGSELSTLKDIVPFIHIEHGLSISYQKAWHAREAALDDIRGSPKDSYKMLPKFAYILKLNNPGILAIYLVINFMVVCSDFFYVLGFVVEYKVDANGRFLYLFMALYASIFCWQHCHPVILLIEQV